MVSFLRLNCAACVVLCARACVRACQCIFTTCATTNIQIIYGWYIPLASLLHAANGLYGSI